MVRRGAGRSKDSGYIRAVVYHFVRREVTEREPGDMIDVAMTQIYSDASLQNNFGKIIHRRRRT